MSERFAVLTGDIVKSSSMADSQLESVMKALADRAEALDQWRNMRVAGFERTRGDGWQCVSASPWFALRAALAFRAAVKQVDRRSDTRISTAIGSARLGQQLASSSGDAFQRSGQGLDSLSGRARFAFSSDMRPDTLMLASAVFRLCDSLSAGWTSRQAEVFFLMAEPDAPTYSALAERLSIEPQSVQAHFARGGGPALIEAATAFETVMAE